MRTILWSTALSVFLIGSVGCKKDEADKVKAAEKNVEEQREDVKDEQKDVREEQKDVNKQQQELAAAKVDLAQARTEYATSVKDRMARIDTRINELEAKGDAKSKKIAADLRVRRDQAAAKLNSIGDRTEANWEEFKADSNKAIDSIEADLDAAFK